ncbi:hypothetical protein GRI39_02155 [Altererythrobacter indicus]|uniref:Uncharacterized protein n=1 Tax=Altericroceibacterium indicum TaxID=374177 RepID=A0A845A3T8_9SPHN|nr:hypothetical protein [Altericroceibacterium indicum]MXP24850.1 hypothetical protein [Altericroceibacterium indicum]
MNQNPGHLPPECNTDDGKIIRVHVQLINGYRTKGKEPAGWAANGRGGCRWSLTGNAHDIEFYEVI